MELQTILWAVDSPCQTVSLWFATEARAVSAARQAFGEDWRAAATVSPFVF